MAFDHKKFIMDRVAGNPVTAADIVDFDTFAAIYTLSMTPALTNIANALNTIEFTKLPKHVQAKVFEGFNKMPISDGYIRAYPSEINAVNERRELIMDAYDVSMTEADLLYRYGLVDMKLLKEYHDYRFEGILPKTKRTAKAKKEKQDG